MPHLIEPAPTGRAKCRGCERPIAKGEQRFGERQPNAFGDGEMTLWFHLPCAAYKRPAAFLEAAVAYAADANVALLEQPAKLGVAHRRVPRVNGAERAATSRARCRNCREPIRKDAWRIGLVFFEDYRFNPGGFIHAECGREYFETVALLDRIAHFSPDLTPGDLDDLAAALSSAAKPA